MARIKGRINKKKGPSEGPRINFNVTQIIPEKPSGKKIYLNNKGELKKETLPPISGGEFNLKEFSSLKEFKQFLESLEPGSAVVYGKFASLSSGEFVSKRRKEAEFSFEIDVKTKTRTREDMTWGHCPGVIMLDYDPPKLSEAMDKYDLIDALGQACPFLKNVEMFWLPSSSSFIENENTGENLTTISGQRIYIVAKDASEIPEIGKEIFERLWLKGYGRFDVSKSGGALNRTLVDGTVWRPEGLDFVGGALTAYPLKQKKLKGQIIKGTKKCVSLADIVPLDASERRDLERIKKEKKREVQNDCVLKKEEWQKQMIKKHLGEDFDEENENHWRLRAQILAATIDNNLYEDFTLQTENGKEVTVAEILDNPAIYNETRFADPLEPDYRNDKRIAWAKLDVERPFIHSFAHGGKLYRLKRRLPEIKLLKGELHRAVDQIIKIMQSENIFYKDRSGTILQTVIEDQVVLVEENWLSDKIARMILLKKSNRKKKCFVPDDIPDRIPKAILAKVRDTNFPILDAVTINPIINLDGIHIDKIGFDPVTNVYFSSREKWEEIPKKPTDEEVKKAFSVLWKPFEKFPFASNLDLSVFFSAILTAVLRPILPTSPAFAIDAPLHGTGKTLLARCLGILVAGKEPDISAPFDSERDVKNKILSLLMEGRKCIIIDNLSETLDSPCLASCLTSREYSDRMLHTNKNISLATRLLWVFTGNNIKIAGDLNRRILVTRIDPKMESGDVLSRSFKIDPARYCLNHRKELVLAALTILSGFYSSRQIELSVGRTPSFEEWSDSVRQCVLWLKNIGLDHLEDPGKAFEKQLGSDENVKRLTHVCILWRKIFESKSLSVRKLNEKLSLTNSPDAIEMKHQLLEVANNGSGEIDTKKLGRWLSDNRDKMVKGKKLILTDCKTNNVSHYKVEIV